MNTLLEIFDVCGSAKDRLRLVMLAVESLEQQFATQVGNFARLTRCKFNYAYTHH